MSKKRGGRKFYVKKEGRKFLFRSSFLGGPKVSTLLVRAGDQEKNPTVCQKRGGATNCMSKKRGVNFYSVQDLFRGPKSFVFNFSAPEIRQNLT